MLCRLCRFLIQGISPFYVQWKLKAHIPRPIIESWMSAPVMDHIALQIAQNPQTSRKLVQYLSLMCTHVMCQMTIDRSPSRELSGTRSLESAVIEIDRRQTRASNHLPPSLVSVRSSGHLLWFRVLERICHQRNGSANRRYSACCGSLPPLPC